MLHFSFYDGIVFLIILFLFFKGSANPPKLTEEQIEFLKEEEARDDDEELWHNDVHSTGT